MLKFIVPLLCIIIGHASWLGAMSAEELGRRVCLIEQATQAAAQAVISLEDAETKTLLLKVAADSALKEAILHYNRLVENQGLALDQEPPEREGRVWYLWRGLENLKKRTKKVAFDGSGELGRGAGGGL